MGREGVGSARSSPAAKKYPSSRINTPQATPKTKELTERASVGRPGVLFSHPRIPSTLLQKGMRPDELSANAMLRKQVTDLSLKLSKLTQQSTRDADRVRELRIENKNLKLAKELHDKALTAVKKSLDRSEAEKGRVQASLENDMAYRKNLEIKLAAGERGPELHSRYVQIRLKQKELSKTVELAKEETCLERSRRETAEREVGILQHALRLQVEELSGKEEGDAKARLLYLLAKGREESVHMALKLAENKEGSKELSNECEMLKGRVDELVAIRESQLEDLLTMEKEKAEITGSANAYKLQYEALSIEAEGLRQSLQEATKEREIAKRESEAMQSSREDLARGLEAMEQTHTINMERMRREHTEEREKLQSRFKTEKHRHAVEVQEAHTIIRTLRAEIDESRAIYESERRMDQDRLYAEQQEAANTMTEFNFSKEREKDMLNEINNLNSEIENLTEANSAIQMELMQAKANCRQDALKLSNLTSQVQVLETQLDSFRSETNSRERKLQDKVQTTLLDLTQAVEERDHIRSKLNEAKTETTSVSGRIEMMQKEIDNLRDLNKSVNESRSDIQRTMMEQVQSMRIQLDASQVQNRDLETTSARLKAEVERLQSVIDSERRTSDTLARQIASQSPFAKLAEGNPDSTTPPAITLNYRGNDNDSGTSNAVKFKDKPIPFKEQTAFDDPSSSPDSDLSLTLSQIAADKIDLGLETRAKSFEY